MARILITLLTLSVLSGCVVVPLHGHEGAVAFMPIPLPVQVYRERTVQ